MAKSKKKEKKDLRVLKIKNLTEQSIGDFCKSVIMVHGANVNISRVIPDARDGLKPVARRILYTMFKYEKMTATSKAKKVSKVVGATMGLFHPQ